MPSMSYCMFENTVEEMKQIVDTMEDARDWDRLNLNEYERPAFFELLRLSAKFLAYANEMMHNEDEGTEAVDMFKHTVREIKFETDIEI